MGTSAVKTLLMNKKGITRGVTSDKYEIKSPKPGYAEQDTEDWWKAVCSAVRWTIKESGVNVGNIVGVCVSGQMHGGVFLGDNLKPLGPAIIWVDTRAKEETREVYEKVGRVKLGKICRSPVATGFLAPTLLWLRKYEREMYKKIRTVLLPKDYIRFRMTGTLATDVSDASATGLFDTAGRLWSAEIMDLLELDRGIFPPCGESIETGGRITSDAAKELGLREGTPVVRGGGDTPAAAVGNGIIEPGTLSVTLGTGGQVIAVISEPIYDEQLRTHTFCHSVPNQWYTMGAILAGGMSLSWLRKLLGERFGFSEFDVLALEIPAGSEGLFFLPYLIGERTPHMDADARGALIGLTPRHTVGHMARAVMEGVAFALKEAFDILLSVGIKVEKVVTGGGGGQSHVWRQILADVLGMELRVLASAESSVTGSAILAAVGTGGFDSIAQACRTVIPAETAFTMPKPENTEIYRKAYSVYRSLYPANESVFHVISSMFD